MAATKGRRQPPLARKWSRSKKHQRDYEALNATVQRKLIALEAIEGPEKPGWTWRDATPPSLDGSPAGTLFLREPALLLDVITSVTSVYEAVDGLVARLGRRADAAVKARSVRLLTPWVIRNRMKLATLLHNHQTVNAEGITFQSMGLSDTPAALAAAVEELCTSPSITCAEHVARLAAAMTARVVGAGFYAPGAGGPLSHYACLFRERGLSYEEIAALMPGAQSREDFEFEGSWLRYRTAATDAVKHRIRHAKSKIARAFGDDSVLEIGAQDLPTNERWVVLFSSGRVEPGATVTLTL
jgi:hypothetical protein